MHDRDDDDDDDWPEQFGFGVATGDSVKVTARRRPLATRQLREALGSTCGCAAESARSAPPIRALQSASPRQRFPVLMEYRDDENASIVRLGFRGFGDVHQRGGQEAVGHRANRERSSAIAFRPSTAATWPPR
jgi:hypothetical protein